MTKVMAPFKFPLKFYIYNYQNKPIMVRERRGVRMKFRHEIKHEISLADYFLLRQRLALIAQRDIHGENGSYQIRSLYFDDIQDSALMEKINGVNMREKFRLRYYDDDVSYIRLEKKSKINSLCSKVAAVLTIQETQRLLSGDLEWMMKGDAELVRELYLKMKSKGLRPKTIVDYHRDAYIFPAGNVRVTLDYNIRTGITCVDFLNRDCITVPVNDNPIILEVKWDEFLPDIIRDAVQLEGRKNAAYSKYAASRTYG